MIMVTVHPADTLEITLNYFIVADTPESMNYFILADTPESILIWMMEIMFQKCMV
jgi:hypothetical protein